MTAPEPFPLPAVVDIADLAPLADPISEGDGVAKGIYPLNRYPGWLLKLYRVPRRPDEMRRLDALIAMPAVVTPGDRALIESSISWPVARVDEGRTPAVGCVMRMAAAKFRVKMRLTQDTTTEKYLEIDWLARHNDAIVRRGLRPPSAETRHAVCRQLIAVAAMLHRHNLVYSDWSYSNAFWCAEDAGLFVIDVDGCGQGSVPNIHQPNWDDPLTPRGQPADTFADRYRVALLVGRCLTGERDRIRVLHALYRYPNKMLASVLHDTLRSRDRSRRPPPSAVLACFEGLPYIRMPLELSPLPPEPPPRATTARPPSITETQPSAAASPTRPVSKPPSTRPVSTPPSTRPVSTPPPSPSTKPRQNAASAVVTVLVLLTLLVLIIIAANSGG